nr:hypothetical protein [Tanacetum cinerariifolium]
MSYLTDYKEIDSGYVAFGGNPKRGKITGKYTIKIGNLDFENVYFVKELKFNLFSVSQMCDKKNSVLFNDTECIVLSPNFKLIDESQVLLRVPRKNNMYNVDLKNIIPKGGLTCLFAIATSDESKLWHRRLGHLNFKTMNKLVKGNLVRGLPSKLFENNQTCVASQKGKQHRASSTKDETSGILKSFITGIENLVDHKVKVIRSDNGAELKNREMNQFCEMKGILRQFSVARTPQQNEVAKRRNRILTETARTMLGDFKLLITFWVEAVNTPCYVQNRVLVVKPHNKTPYELFHGRTPILSFMRPFGCPVTFLNTIDHLGKFNGKADEGFFVGYYLNSKAFKVFNSKTRIVEENLHIRFSKSTSNVVGTKASDNVDPKSSHDDGSKPSSDDGMKVDDDPRKESECRDQEKEDNVNRTNNVSTAGNLNTVSSTVNVASTNKDNELSFDPNMLALEDVSIFSFSCDDEDDGTIADMNNLDTTIQVSPILTIIIHKDHPLDQVIRNLQSATQTRKMTKNLEENGVELCNAFERLMHEKFQMSSMGELTFFLGLQVKQKEDGIFISQEKYVAKILKKFRSMIGSLMYLTSLRPDIMFVVCACARYQVNLKVSHLHAMKRIFRYLKGQPKLGLWYPKDSPFDLVAYTDSDYAGASLDRKSTTRGKEIVITESSVRRDLQLADMEGIDCLPNSTIFEQLALMGKPKRKDTQVPQPSGPTKFVVDEAIHKELGDSLVRVATTTSSLETSRTVRVLDLEHTKTSQKNEIDSLKRRVKKFEKRNRSRTHKLKRLYKVGLTARVESFSDEESLGEDVSKQERRIDAIDADEDITLVNDSDNEMFDVDDLGGDEVFVVKGKEKSTLQLKEQKREGTTINKYQERKIMCTYLKNMDGYKLKDLNLKEFDSIPKMFDKAFKRVNTFEDFRTELVEGKEKRAGEELEHEITKKQKVDDYK